MAGSEAWGSGTADMGDLPLWADRPGGRSGNALAVGWAAVHSGEAQPGVTLFREIARALYQRDYADPP